MNSRDDELRAITFLKVQELRERFTSRIPRASLMEGVMLQGQRAPIWNYQKGIFKPAALGRDGAALSVQTSADSPYEDLHDPESGRFIYKYRGQDPEHPDNVALRRAMQLNKPLLYLVAVDPGVYDAVLPVYVTGDDPTSLQFLMMVDQAPASQSPSDSMLTTVRREYVTRAVMQRLHQQHFRRMVLRAYKERCAICRLGHRSLLDAAHILPDKDPRGEAAVNNGLGRCKIHHSAYDANILGIDADARVHIREDILIEKDGPMLRQCLQETHGNSLILPREHDLRPNRAFLAERFDRFRAA
jgi:putative restriction endonuclease